MDTIKENCKKIQQKNSFFDVLAPWTLEIDGILTNLAPYKNCTNLNLALGLSTRKN
jgi:hypothetical protein